MVGNRKHSLLYSEYIENFFFSIPVCYRTENQKTQPLSCDVWLCPVYAGPVSFYSTMVGI